MDYNFTMEKIRFHLLKQDTLVFFGWYRGDNPDKRTLAASLDKKGLPLQIRVKKGLEIRQKYLNYRADINEEIYGEISLPGDWREHNTLRIRCMRGTEEKTIFKITVSRLQRLQKEVAYYLESEQLTEGRVLIGGWAAGAAEVSFRVQDESEEKEVALERFYRKDIAAIYEELPADYRAGFKLTVPAAGLRRLTLIMESGDAVSSYRTSLTRMKAGKTKAHAAAPGLLKKVKAYYTRNGLRATVKRVKTKLLKEPEQKYDDWRKQHQISEQEQEAQKNAVFSYTPLFSVVIPLYRTPRRYLFEMLDSVLAQTYGEWELCLADGSGEDTLKGLIEERYGPQERFHYRLLEENGGISENTNAAIRMAKGDYIVFADHDDLMAPQALYECARLLEKEPDTDVIYSDEDKVDENSKVCFEPNFKPDFSPDLLTSMNYICHLFVVKRELLHKAGMLRREFDGAQDYDLILRCTEQAKKIRHIPCVLYHWRHHLDSTAASPESKLYAFEAGKRALEGHYSRIGIPARVEHAAYYGMYHTIYEWQEKPLISILIPNKDHLEDLRNCVGSLFARSRYRNFEIIIIENNSTQESTFAGYRELETAYENVRTVTYRGGFNFSRINNFGAQYARGEYLLLLNNDTELISENALWELLSLCMRRDVGIVGAKLNYADDTIQHAGVVIGFGGIAGHTFIGSSRYDLGYQARIVCVQNYSAVTAACMMTKKELFLQAGGLTEELEVAFNDIDYCMKIRAMDKLVVYNPYAEFYHYESKSRGLEDTPKKVARFNREADKFRERWPEILEKGDPYFNPNLSLDKADFSLK